MFTEIKKIAEANKDGFTVEIETLKHVTAGIVVAYQETQDSHGDEGLKKCIEHALQHEKIVGGWFNFENKTFYFDSCKTFKDLTEAMKFGRENSQIAIFDLDNLREIRL
jgi:hypothetical protein